MKKAVSLVILTSLLFSLGAPAALAEGEELGVSVSASAAIVLEPETGSVLYEKNADERMLIASTTKIMTALVVLERCELDESVEVTWTHAATEGSSMYLDPEKSYTAEDLLYGLLLVSGNDAAAALADHVGGNMEGFAELMNDKAAQLGLENTHFVNAHGLDAEGHYSSARDLALITAAALENDDFREIFSARSYTLYGLTYVNHNKLLGSCEGCIGGKTGYTLACGRTLVSCAERGGMTLICVTLRDPDDWNDHCALYDWAYSAYELVPFLTERARRVEVMSGLSEFAELTTPAAGVLAAKTSAVQRKVYLPMFVYAPVMSGESLGRAELWVDGELAGSEPIVCRSAVLTDETNLLSPWERIKRALEIAGNAGVYYSRF
ncbi:MAG: D-alanyl-D-alanine carboxypeptidase [Oscillospiraceae bacterium]|nr:D-alanyl-D-alanine carboxypeptidase [Oscillospiraceae bacterium]